MASVRLNYVNVSDYSENVWNLFLYEKAHWYLKNDFKFFDILKTKDRKIRGNCNLLIKLKVKLHELEWSSPLKNGATHTDLSIKLTDSHQYLHYKSSHPLHIKTAITYSLALRINRICSLNKDFKAHVSHMKE